MAAIGDKTGRGRVARRKRSGVDHFALGAAHARRDNSTGAVTITAPVAECRDRARFMALADALAKVLGVVVWQCHQHPVDVAGVRSWQAAAAQMSPTLAAGRWGEG